MKKFKFFAVAAILCAAGFAGYAAYERATMTDEEKIFQANLEALTQDDEYTLDLNWGPQYVSNYGGMYCCVEVPNSYCEFVPCSEYNF